MSKPRCSAPLSANDPNGVTQHWTLSGQSVVLSGPRERLQELADDLHVAHDQIVEVSTTRAVLALWGAPLETFQERKSARTDPNGAGP